MGCHRRRHHPLVGLLLAVGLLLPTVAAAAEQEATPGLDRGPTREGVTVDRLVEETLGSLALSLTVDTLALARVTLAPGATTRARNGEHLFVVGSGALTVQTYAHTIPPPPGTPGALHEEVPLGPPVTHGAGDHFLVVYDVVAPPSIANEGPEPAVALVVSLAVTRGAGIEDTLTGWTAVEPLAVASVARVGPPLTSATGLGSARIVVALDRATYDRQATLDFVWVDPAARLFAVEAGALNVLAIDPALFTAAGDAPQELPATARVSPLPGDQLLVPSPGRIATRNVARGPSRVLIVTIGAAVAATTH